MSDESSFKTLKGLLLQRTTAQRTLEEHRKTTFDLQERERRLEAEEEKTRQAVNRAAGLAYLEGKDAPADLAKLRKRLERINEQRGPLPDAIQISAERQHETELQAREIEQSIANVGFTAASEIRKKSAQAVTELIAAAEPHLAAMSAADSLVRSFTEMQPALSLDDHPDEFSGAFVVGKLLGGLTHFTRPESLTEANCKIAVDRAKGNLLAQITEGVEE